MNSQDYSRNTQQNTPTSSAVTITGTNALGDEFIIGENSENPLIPTEQSTTSESPLLSDDDSIEVDLQVPPLNIGAIINIHLPRYTYLTFDNNTPVFVLRGRNFSNTLTKLIIMAGINIVSAIFFIVSINSSNSSEAIFFISFFIIFSLSFLIFYEIKKLIAVKRNYELCITIHEDEIIFHENSAQTPHPHVFPRDPMKPIQYKTHKTFPSPAKNAPPTQYQIEYWSRFQVYQIKIFASGSKGFYSSSMLSYDEANSLDQLIEICNYLSQPQIKPPSEEHDTKSDGDFFI